MITGIEPLEGFTFGCDPELFILDDKDTVVSAEGLVPGTKEEPFRVPGGAVQRDGVLAEFNIHPCSSYGAFRDSISVVMKHLQHMLPEGYRLLCAPSHTFTEKQWARISDSAKELGCSPDINAWTGEVNLPPDGDISPGLRTASGHLHIGWTGGVEETDPDHMRNCRDLVKQLDWYLGEWSLSKDLDHERRKLYGNAGACRFKDYGVEYRTLSNFWLKSPRVQREMWNRMQSAIHRMSSDFLPETRAHFNDRVVKSINNSERDLILAEECSFFNGSQPLFSVKELTHG